MIVRLSLAAAALALLGASGCSSAPTTARAWTPTPPARYLDTPPPSFSEPEPLDPLADVMTRVRMLEIGNEWPPADWLAGAPVDQGDGVLRVRPPDCRRGRWTSSSSAVCASRGRESGRRGGRSRPWRGAHVRAW